MEVSFNVVMDVVKVGGVVVVSVEWMMLLSIVGEVVLWYMVVLMIYIFFECMCVDVCR